MTDQYKSPLVIHCSAGVGRTGTFLALRSLLEYIKYNNIVNIVDVVLYFRRQRMFIVQTDEQYLFILNVLHDLFIKN